MLKKIMIAFFSFKLIGSLAVLLYDIATPGSYIEIAGEDWFLSSIRLFLLAGIFFYALLIYGIYSGRRWVLPLYTIVLLLMIFTTGYVCYDLYNLESFSIIALSLGAFITLCVPILIWLGLYRLSGEIDAAPEAKV